VSSTSTTLTIKDKVRCPVISVEGWRDPLRIAQALRRIDAVSMCRLFIREPHLAARWRNCDLTPAKCISCNRCLDLIVDRGLGCTFHKGARDRAVTDA
jgi:2,4-dienoyl-CoA reductase-like NADH-dependent reductase (Old Yellow Enzyme family)